MNTRQTLAILSTSIGAVLPLCAAQPAKPVFTSPLVHTEPVAIKADLTGAKELFLVATDGADGFNADWADWMEPVLIKADGTRIKLTELKPKAANVAWGKMALNGSPDGINPMRVNGKNVPFGFGAHAPSLIGFDLPAGVVGLEAKGGIDEGGTAQGTGATVKFMVFTEQPPAKILAVSTGGGDAGDKPYGLEAAKEAVTKMVTPEGLSVSLFAAEPMIQNPTNIDIDHRGRVWATEAVNYRGKMDLRPAGDRVVILEDSDGDGMADKETTFFQDVKLTNPLGICVMPQLATAGTQVLVSAAPNLWLLTDTDGDDKADKAEILLKVGGSWNHDHQLHSFNFGVDGKFYFNIGNESQKITNADGSPIVDMAGNEINNTGKPYRQGMVFRADLVNGKLANIETLGWNFRNNYEVCIDSFGTLWQSDNDDDGNKGVRINYVMEFGNYGFTDEITGAGWSAPRTNLESEIPRRHWHLNDPGVVPNLLQTGAGSPTGILLNEGTLLGKMFTNQLIHCDAGPRTVRAYPVENDGAGYKATMVDILTAPNDTWYRPSDVSIAPDGSLFIADWYDPGVGGHAMGDNDGAKMRGRLYRVAPAGAKLSVPKADFSTAAGAAAALQSPNHGTQYAAWQKLHALGAQAQPDLEKLWKNENPRIRARAIHLLARIPGNAQSALDAALSDPDPNLRIAGMRFARELKLDVVVATKKLLKDPSAQVRRECAIALRGISSPEAPALWASLAQQHDGNDRWYLEALGIGASGNEERFFDAWLAAAGTQWNSPAGRDIVWRSRTPKAAAYLAKIIADNAVAAPEKLRFIRAFDFLTASPEKSSALISLAGGANESVTIEALSRLAKTGLSDSPEVKAAISSVLAASKETPRFVSLVRDFRLKGEGAALLDVALKKPTDPSAVEAVRMVLAESDASNLINTAASQPGGAKLIDLLGANSDRGGLNVLMPILTDPNREPALRGAAVSAMARTPQGVEALLKLAREGKFPESLKLIATGALNSVQLPKYKDQIAQLFPAPNALGGKPLPPIAELVKAKGDAARGKMLFEKAETTCVSCHRAGAAGVDFAPALSEIGSKLGKDALYESIINPNAGISMGFETWLIETKNGGAAMGLIRSETAEELVLALPMGITNKFSKKEIAKREKLPNSIMPSGLNQALSQQDLVDMVEYLASLKKP
ncbi:MAG: hypothetical protein JWL59_2772 [Chthoniobacteraceae bacterium]|nr:hypothetical protein [Chthoniobacteraceae bacterium]